MNSLAINEDKGLVDKLMLLNLVTMHELLEKRDLNKCRNELKEVLAMLEQLWIDDSR